LVPAKDEVVKSYPHVTDHQLLMDNLRSKCVFEVTKDSDPDELHFFNYLFDMKMDCVMQNRDITDWCSNDVLKSIKVKPDEVD
jgi:hypothetical protein